MTYPIWAIVLASVCAGVLLKYAVQYVFWPMMVFAVDAAFRCLLLAHTDKTSLQEAVQDCKTVIASGSFTTYDLYVAVQHLSKELKVEPDEYWPNGVPLTKRKDFPSTRLKDIESRLAALEADKNAAPQ